MKTLRFLLLLSAPLFFAACSDDDNNPTEKPVDFTQGVEYSCTLAVTDNAAGTTANDQTGIVCRLDPNGDTFNLTMREVRFTDNPREPVKTIVFPALALSESNGTTHVTSTLETIIPEIGGTPYEDYAISDFECTITDEGNTLHLRFVCTNPTYRLDHTAQFSGERIR